MQNSAFLNIYYYTGKDNLFSRHHSGAYSYENPVCPGLARVQPSLLLSFAGATGTMCASAVQVGLKSNYNVVCCIDCGERAWNGRQPVSQAAQFGCTGSGSGPCRKL